jgi:antagonist of KipI
VGPQVSAAPAIEVLKPGLLTSVQDQGRPGRAAIALSRGGAADRRAMALANVLVGNAPGAAGLEITGPGPVLRVEADAWVACVGARHPCRLARADEPGPGLALPARRPVFVPAGATLRWQAPEAGWRSWLAVAGGIALPEVLGSRSAHLAAGIGPPRLAAGDRLPLAPDAAALARSRAAAVLRRADPAAGRPWPPWHLPEDLPAAWPQIELPVLAGRHLGLLSAAARRALLETGWTVGAQSNRQGLRLEGPPLDTRGLPQLASEPVGFGTVQLPPAGLPVVLEVEHQTTGGYPRVLEAAAAAEPLLAQAAPGCRVRFRLVELDEADRLAHRLAVEHRQRVAGIRTTCGHAFEGER